MIIFIYYLYAIYSSLLGLNEYNTYLYCGVFFIGVRSRPLRHRCSVSIYTQQNNIVIMTIVYNILLKYYRINRVAAVVATGRS